MLNKIFIGMFLIAISMALGKLIFWQDLNIFDQLVKALFSAAETGFTISLGLTGVLCLWNRNGFAMIFHHFNFIG